MASQSSTTVTPTITLREREHYVRQKDKARFSSPEEEIEEYAKRNSKKCTKCGETKLLTQFKRNTCGTDAFDRYGYRLLRPECTSCTDNIRRGKGCAKQSAKAMGIPYKAPPGTKCGICGKEGKRGDTLVFDHCHTTNTFRGYLHNSCNRSLGVLGDDTEGMVRVINYLMKTTRKKISQDPMTGELLIG